MTFGFKLAVVMVLLGSAGGIAAYSMPLARPTYVIVEITAHESGHKVSELPIDYAIPDCVVQVFDSNNAVRTQNTNINGETFFGYTKIVIPNTFTVTPPSGYTPSSTSWNFDDYKPGGTLEGHKRWHVSCFFWPPGTTGLIANPVFTFGD